LFFYAQTTHLPSRHTQLFWSVDTSVELFGVKFTILFVISLFVLTILVSFNILLLFTRLLLRFKFVSKFKPLLDPYLSLYKDKCYFWTGLQLLLRSVFFSLSAVDRNVSLFTASVIVGFLLCTHGVLSPFKSRFHNIQESCIILNLLLVHMFALYNGWGQASSLIIRECLILVVLVYFILFIIYTGITAIFHKNMFQLLRTVFRMHVRLWKGWRRDYPKVQQNYCIENLSDKIPDVTFDYTEFREPLVAVID